MAVAGHHIGQTQPETLPVQTASHCSTPHSTHFQKFHKKWNVVYTMKQCTMIRRKWKSAYGKRKSNLKQRIKCIENMLKTPKPKIKEIKSAFKMMAS